MKDRIYLDTHMRAFPLLHCPKCQAEVDSISTLRQRRSLELPKPGAVTICLHCGAVLRFTPNPATPSGMQLIEVPKYEVAEMAAAYDIFQKALRAAHEAIAERKNNPLQG